MLFRVSSEEFGCVGLLERVQSFAGDDGYGVSGPTDVMMATSMLESVVFQAIERNEAWHYKRGKNVNFLAILYLGERKSDYYFPDDFFHFEHFGAAGAGAHPEPGDLPAAAREQALRDL